ncbi:unnamed protein product, partial [Musa hybrid cultivar]
RRERDKGERREGDDGVPPLQLRYPHLRPARRLLLRHSSLICLATFLKVPENDNFDPYQELLKALIGFIDVARLYFALTQLTHRNISQNHKFQALGLGREFADSILHRLAPLWVGARGLEFTWEYIFQGVEANANLVLNLSLAALGSLMWLRKNKPRTLIPIIYACAGVLATMP